jgi:hypothetical protein
MLTAVSIVLTLALCLMVLFKRRTGLSEVLLLVGLLGVAGAELLDWRALNVSGNVLMLERWRLGAQGLACWAWVGFSLVFARTYQDTPPPKLQLALLTVFLALPLLPAALPAKALLGPVSRDAPWIIPLSRIGFYHHLGLLTAVLLCLYNLEATLANATHARRWRIKFFVLGIMAMLASQFLVASEGLLFKGLDLSLNPTRQIGLILGVVLMGYSIITRGGEEKIIFSRRLAYKSLVLFAAGLYLVGIGLTGQYIRFFDGLSKSMMLMSLSVMGGVGLLAVFLSETLRRKANLALRKYFYRDKYDYRLQWLDFTRRLSAVRQRQDLYQAVLLGFCESLGMGQGALYLRNPTTRDFESAHRWEMGQTDSPIPAGHPLGEPLGQGPAVRDLRGRHPGPPLPEASFLVPLMQSQNLEGFILLARPFNTDEEYDEEDFELMEALANQASLAIFNMRLVEELAMAREMEIMGRISSFVLHDLKNLVYTLSLILENAKNYIHEPEFQSDLLTSLGNTVSKMNTLISQLRVLPDKESLRREHVDLLDLAKESAKAVDSEAFQVKGEPVPATVNREEMNKVLINLFRNAQEACQGNIPVTVEVGNQGQPYVKVSDSGCGMDEEFMRSHLFAPFNTTKDTGMGIGLYQSKQIVEAHGGRLMVESRLGQGSTFTVLLPNSQAG